MFHTRNQQPGEPIDQYVTDLKLKAKSCAFGTLTDSLITDRIVCGILDDRTRSRLLKEADLTLQAAVSICRANETTAAHMKDLSKTPGPAGEATPPNDHDIHAIHKGTNKASRHPLCGKCGNSHSYQQRCPAYGAECLKCGKRNHFARVCRSKIPPERRPGKPHIQSIEEDENSDGDSPFVYTVNRNKRKDEKDWHVTIKVDHGHPTFKIDTGAQCNVMSIETYQQVTSQPLQKSHTRLITFSGHKIKSHGRARLLCEHKNRYTVAEFEIVKGCQNVLGLKTITDMKLVKRIDALSTTEAIIEEYADVFTGLGCVTNTLHHIKLDPAHTPVVHPPRRVPAAMRQKVKDELERMERLEVIERVHEPTDWVNSMVTATKSNGKLRICIDPRDLNKAIKREHYPMPTIEDVLTRIPKAKVFSVLDATSGYWQIQLDESSAKLCTFNTPFGRYMFKRLPFGVSSAQDVFQAIMTDIFGDIEGVEVVVDDLLIWAENDEQHDTILRKTLDRARQ